MNNQQRREPYKDFADTPAILTDKVVCFWVWGMVFITIPQNITKLLSGVDGLNSIFYNMLMTHISTL